MFGVYSFLVINTTITLDTPLQILFQGDEAHVVEQSEAAHVSSCGSVRIVFDLCEPKPCRYISLAAGEEASRCASNCPRKDFVAAGKVRQIVSGIERLAPATSPTRSSNKQSRSTSGTSSPRRSALHDGGSLRVVEPSSPGSDNHRPSAEWLATSEGENPGLHKIDEYLHEELEDADFQAEPSADSLSQSRFQLSSQATDVASTQFDDTDLANQLDRANDELGACRAACDALKLELQTDLFARLNADNNRALSEAVEFAIKEMCAGQLKFLETVLAEKQDIQDKLANFTKPDRKLRRIDENADASVGTVAHKRLFFDNACARKAANNV